MLRGISFIDNADKLFLNLESAMDISGHDWYVDDIYGNDYREGRYSAQELRDALPDISEFCFVRMRRYPVGACISAIMTYDEYLQSQCDVLILFYDGGYCQIYSKDEAVTHKLYGLAEQYGFDNLKYVSDENDSRTGMCY